MLLLLMTIDKEECQRVTHPNRGQSQNWPHQAHWPLQCKFTTVSWR